jgi:hypothetical protein
MINIIKYQKTFNKYYNVLERIIVCYVLRNDIIF